MANKSAYQNGDWNALTTWSSNSSVPIPTAADAVNLNGKLLSMAAGTYATCLSLTDTAGTTAKLTMAAGTVLSCPTLLGKAMVEVAGKGVTIYAETIDNSAGVVGARPTISVLSGGMLSGRGNVGGGANYQTIEPQENGLISAWIGDINPGNSLYPAIYGSGSINDIWGDITGGSNLNGYGINCSVQEVHGNIKGGSASGAHGIKLSGGAAIGHIYGNVEGGSASGAHGVDLSISGFGYCNLYKVYGNAIGGSASGAHGIRVTGSGTGYNQFISGVGDVIPGVSGAYGLWMDANGWNATYQWAYITTGRSPTDTGCSAGTSTPIVRQATSAEIAQILLNMPVQPRHIAASADILFGVARYQNAPASMNGTLFSLDPGVSKVLTTAANPYYINSVAKTPTLPVSAVLATSGGTCILPAAGSVALGVPVGVPPAVGTAILTLDSVQSAVTAANTAAGLLKAVGATGVASTTPAAGLAGGLATTPNTDKYWYKTGADAHWNTVTGNWWTSAAHNVQSVLPVAGDSVYLTGSTIPDTAPSAITLARFDTSLLAADLTGTTTSSITIASKGVLVLGSAANPSYSHRWWGSAAADASISFYGASSNQTTILGNAAFYNTSHNNATVAGNALFYDSSYNQYWVQGNAKFYDTSYNPSVVSGSAKFYDNSYTENNVGPFSVWYDASYAQYNAAAGNVSVGDNWRWYSSMPRYLHANEPFAWVWGGNGYEHPLAWQAAVTAANNAAISSNSAVAVPGSLAGLARDKLNAAVDSRMATFTYTAPDNTGIGTAASQATAAASSAATAASQATTAASQSTTAATQATAAASSAATAATQSANAASSAATAVSNTSNLPTLVTTLNSMIETVA